MGRCHGPDELANTASIQELHTGCKLVLYGTVWVASGGIKLLDPIRVQGKWSRPISHGDEVIHPCGEVFLRDLFDERRGGDLDVVMGLLYVDPVIHI